MTPNAKVLCIDDSGWLIPDPGYEHLAPRKGQVYVVMAVELFGSVLAISLVGGNPDDFYRACRFRLLSDAREQEDEEKIAVDSVTVRRYA